MRSEKTKAKYMENVWKSFFQLANWHLATSLLINLNFFHKSFSGVFIKWTPSTVNFSILYEIIE